MRKLVIILFCLISVSLNAATYYVATTGNDSNGGSLASPFLTWKKAFDLMAAGDTVFIRGGVYNIPGGSDGYYINTNGTVTDTLCVFNYPGETPILDCTGFATYAYGTTLVAFNVNGNYVKVKGLTVRNLWQVYANDGAIGISIWQADNTTVENCTAYNIGGTGFEIAQSINLRIINCDAYNCYDILGDPEDPGNDGYGFMINNTALSTATTYFTNCRTWLCGDDGFTFYEIGYVEMDSCWTFRNGQLDGGGSGIKLGFIHADPTIPLRRKVTNCVAAYNRSVGITCNDNNSSINSMHIYNNTIYHSGYQGSGKYYGLEVSGTPGIQIYNTTSSDSLELTRTFKNNISYDNEGVPVFVGYTALYTHAYNSWDTPPGVTITDDDFVSVDSTGITAARQADGSLPDNDCYNNFLKLAATSDLINAGTDVGLDYNGDAPDLGYSEYILAGDPTLPSVATYTPYAITINRAITGGYMINDGGSAISAKGVCWGTDINPDLADNVVSGGTGVDDFVVTINGLSPHTTYHVRAYATNETGTRYGATETFTTSQSSIVKFNGKIVKR